MATTDLPPPPSLRPSHNRTPSREFIAAHSRSNSRAHSFASVPQHAEEDDSLPHTYIKGKTLLGGLIKPPTVRQFLYNGKFYREEEDRTQSHFELFADLVFVGIVHILGEVAAEEATLFNAAKFVLLFWPPWSIWSDMRSYINVSGTDDAVQRLYILTTSLLLVGYTANAAAVEIESVEEEGGHTKMEIPHQSFRVLHAAVGFFLVAKALRLILYLVYAIYLPRFRVTHLIEAVFTIISCAIFVPLLFVTTAGPVIAIIIIGVTVSILSRYITAIVIHKIVDRPGKSDAFIPAISISHVIERTTAFVVLISGEMLINISYIASDDQTGLSPEYGRSVLGLTIAFLFCWIYFDSDSARVFVHALRRHWFSSVSFTQVHLPLCGALIIVSAAMHEMVSTNEVDIGITWYFCAGSAVVMLCLATVGFLHKSLDLPGSGLAPRWFRVSLRALAGVFFAVLPKFNISENSLIFEIVVAVLAFIVIAETVAKIGTVGHRSHHHHSHLQMPHLHLSNMLPHHHHEHEHQLSQSHPFEPKLTSTTTTIVGDGSETPLNKEHVELDAFRAGNKTFKSAELTAYEKGEEDVGGDESVGILRATTVRRGQRTAFAAL